MDGPRGRAPRARQRRLWLHATLLSLFAAVAAAAPPPPGRCPQLAPPPGAKEMDGGAPLLQEGDVLDFGRLQALRSLFPEQVWAQRDVFFHEGMRMEIGACHRVYPPAAFYDEATRKYASRVSLDDEGNLRGYVAGLPFPPEAIDPADPAAAMRWAWNLQYRYRGAGPVGRFRLLDLPGRIGSPETYLGSFFFVATGHRADLAASDHRVPESKRSSFVAGGRFDEPFNARHLAWRQIRPDDADASFSEPDDTFVYVPTMRKPRRAATTWVDGVFTPRYSVSGDSGGGGVPYAQGGSEYAPNLQSIQPTAGTSIAATEHMPKGFTGLALRPNAYRWRLVGEREVLAPLNAVTPGWPEQPDRNYGPWGLSVASDRWDVRQAVVIEGVRLRRTDEVHQIEIWIDHQTQQPLYWLSRRQNGLPMDVGILVHRYSGDRAEYPAWPGGEPAAVFDPVAAAFFWVPDGGSGWRRESYDVRSVPVDPEDLRALTSTDALLKGR